MIVFALNIVTCDVFRFKFSFKMAISHFFNEVAYIIKYYYFSL